MGHLLPVSLDTYSQYATRFLLFVLRCAEIQVFSRFVHKFGNIFNPSLILGAETEEQVMEIVHHFLLQITTEKKSIMENKTQNTLLTFLVFSSVSKDGGFMDPKLITPYISKLKYLLRSVVITEILKNP
jgi:hypothetical protein